MKQISMNKLSLIAAVGLLTCAFVARAEYSVQVNATANLRAKPDVKSAKVGQVKAKDRVRILTKSRDISDPKKMKDLWFKVETSDGKQGWMAGSVIAKTKLVKPPMGYDTAPSAPTPSDSGMAPAAPMDTEAPTPSESAAQPAAPAAPADEIPDIEILDSTDTAK